MNEPAIDALVALARGRTIVALTGAGCSTESGIPDYRSPGAVRRTPMQHREFVDRADARRRYWARSLVGWPALEAARPNDAHRALAALEERGALAGVITQNVDGLHGAAGSRRVVELHGALARVRCLVCEVIISRTKYQEELLATNPDRRFARTGMAPASLAGRGDQAVGRDRAALAPASLAGRGDQAVGRDRAALAPASLAGRGDQAVGRDRAALAPASLAGRGDQAVGRDRAALAPASLAGRGDQAVGRDRAALAPDGDAELADVAGFAVAPCAACGGVVMPDVVFFGGSVPRATLDAAWTLFDRAELLLVAGTSLAVFSGYRFVRRATERGVPIAIVNRGPTRGDDHAAVKLDANVGELLPALAAALA